MQSHRAWFPLHKVDPLSMLHDDVYGDHFCKSKWHSLHRIRQLTLVLPWAGMLRGHLFIYSLIQPPAAPAAEDVSKPLDRSKTCLSCRCEFFSCPLCVTADKWQRSSHMYRDLNPEMTVPGNHPAQDYSRQRTDFICPVSRQHASWKCGNAFISLVA